MKTLKIGTRGSPLARWQATYVQHRLEHIGIGAEIVVIRTSGDAQADRGEALVAGKGIFVKELEVALENGEVDLAVHSAKDVPTELARGLELSAVCPRADSRDCLVSTGRVALFALPHGARVGTGSLRRKAQLIRLRPDLDVRPLRGNVHTRLRRVEEGGYHAVVLAKAGLDRLELSDRVAEVLDPEQFLPAVGQGVVVLESRVGDTKVAQVAHSLEDHDCRAALSAERSLLRELEGGCQVPIGAWARVDNGTLRLDAAVFGLDGSTCLRASGKASLTEAAALGIRIGRELLEGGAANLLANVRGQHG